MHKLVSTLIISAAISSVVGLSLDVSSRYEINNCASGGSSSVSPVEGKYLFRVTTADSWVCLAGTCASGGEHFSAGTVLLWQVPRGGQTISCRSTASTGNVILTRVY